MSRVASLHVYPIKSCAALALKACRLDLLGASYDRRFMVVDESGRLLSQRQQPRLALVRPVLAPTSLRVEATGMPRLDLALKARDPRAVRVRVWEFDGEAEDAGETAADWFSDFLGVRCRVVRFADHVLRPVSREHTERESYVAFTDAYPLLLTSRASLDDVNQQASSRLTMDRFRPNLVVEGADAYSEDDWKRLRIGEVELDVVKPCERCKTVTVDQATGQAAPEVMDSLAKVRGRDGGVFFGMNCVHHGPGSIRVGDEVEVLE